MDDKTLMPPPSFFLKKPKQTTTSKPQNETEDDKHSENEKVIITTTTINNDRESENEDSEQQSNAEMPKVDLLYTPPYWSAKPSSPFNLEVLKNGTIIETISLNTKGHYLFGRLVGDILLDHQSISRQHAVIQFRANPEVAFLYDLGSSHGTFVNKKQIKPKSYHPLKNGDILRFGMSTRFYVFSAPERDVNAIQQKDIRMNNPLAHLFTQKPNAKETEKSGNSGVSWGIMDNDEEVYESAGDQIYIGGDDDLIDLEAEFDDDEKGKKKKKKEKETTKPKEKEKDKSGEIEENNKRVWADDDFSSGDDSDDYFDRTETTKKKSQKKKKVERKVETHESLIVKREELKNEQQVIERELATLERANQTNLKEVSTTDSLDAFMVSAGLTVTDEKIKKLKMQLKNVIEESAKLDKLISFTQPAFQKTQLKTEQVTKGETSTKITTTSPISQVEKTSHNNNNKSNSNNNNNNKNNTSKTISIQKLFSSEEEPERKKGIDPKHLLSKVEITHNEKNSIINNSNNNDNTPKSLAQQILPDSQSQFSKGETLTFDDDNNNNNLEQHNNDNIKNRKGKSKFKSDHDHKEKESEESDLVPKYEEWVPPENQTGSGRTKLNDLYGY